MKLTEAHAEVCEARHVRRLDQAAVAVERAKPDVVPVDDENVGRAVACARWLERRPVGLRIADIQGNASLKALLWHEFSLGRLPLDHSEKRSAQVYAARSAALRG